MDKLIFTFFNGIYGKTAKPESHNWDEWIKIFSNFQIIPGNEHDKKDLENKKNIDGVVLASYSEGATRAKKNIKKVYAMGLDIDDKTDEEIEKALNKIKQYEFIIYSTYKHQAACVNGISRLRIILPFNEPLDPQKYKIAWENIYYLTKGLADVQTKDASRFFFMPSSYNKERTFFWHNKGEFLNPEELKIEKNTIKTNSCGVNYETLIKSLKLLPKTDTLKNHFDLLLNKKPFAEPGERHKAILDLTMRIAQRKQNNFPEISLIEKLFTPSIEIMQQLDSSSPGIEDVITAYEGAKEKIIDSTKEYQLKGQTGYTKEEIKKIIEKQELSLEELENSWIIQKGISYYVLDKTGNYQGPFIKDEARPAMASILARAPILINEPTPSGIRRRTPLELVEDFGTVAKEVIVDLTASYSKFERSSGIIREATRPIRSKIKPEYDEQIDKYLQLLGGDQYEKLCDWLACVPDLKKLLCALYLAGAPGNMKTSIAFGLAKLWHSGPPAEIARVLSDFNEDLLMCPLILADEGLPRTWKGLSITTQLRSMISTYQRTLSRKYLPPSTMQGAIRLILAANNEFLLKSSDVMNASDLQAIAQRFLYIQTTNEATQYIEKLDRETKDKWGAYKIAAHSLWLSKNREVIPGKRFWVEGDISQMHRLLMSSSDFNSMVIQWLVMYLMNPSSINAKQDGLIKIRDGKLLVNDQAIIDGWSLYFPQTRIEPSAYKIGAALRAISVEKRIQLRIGNRRIRYRDIDLDNLFAWSENSNIGDREAMEYNLGIDNQTGVRKKNISMLEKIRKGEEK